MIGIARQDHPEAVMKHAGLYAGKTALIVLGGESGARWESIREAVKPDVIIGVNGVNAMIPDLDYWLCIENMRGAFSKAQQGSQEHLEIVKMYQRTGPRWRFANWKSGDLLKDQHKLVYVQRSYGLSIEDFAGSSFSWRLYGTGLLTGPLFSAVKTVNAPLRLGTVSLQALHLASILGAAKIYTIGWDMVLSEKQHWYVYPDTYRPGEYFNEGMFVEYDGLPTTAWWLDTARYLVQLRPLLEAEKIEWIDLSKGLMDRINEE